MVAQFITLFAGLVITLENYIRQTLIAAGEVDTTVEKISILTYLVYFFNGAVVVWPTIDGFMQADPSETLQEFKNMYASFVGSDNDSESADPPILNFADKVEELVVGPVPYHTTALERPDAEHQIQFQQESNQDSAYVSAGQVCMPSFEHAGGVRAQPEAGQPG